MTEAQPGLQLPKVPKLSRHQVRQIVDTQTCGTCALCCKILEIKEEPEKNFTYKPFNTWCKHCKPGNWPGGCTRHDDQPEACSAFECVWLQSHKRRDVMSMPPSMKPSSSKVILVQSQEDFFVLFAFVDPKYPKAWRNEPIRSHLIRVAQSGCTVIVVVDTTRFVMSKDRPTYELSEGQLQELTDIRIKMDGKNLMKAARPESALDNELRSSVSAPAVLFQPRNEDEESK